MADTLQSLGLLKPDFTQLPPDFQGNPGALADARAYADALRRQDALAGGGEPPPIDFRQRVAQVLQAYGMGQERGIPAAPTGAARADFGQHAASAPAAVSRAALSNADFNAAVGSMIDKGHSAREIRDFATMQGRDPSLFRNLDEAVAAHHADRVVTAQAAFPDAVYPGKFAPDGRISSDGGQGDPAGRGPGPDRGSHTWRAAGVEPDAPAGPTLGGLGRDLGHGAFDAGVGVVRGVNDLFGTGAWLIDNAGYYSGLWNQPRPGDPAGAEHAGPLQRVTDGVDGWLADEQYDRNGFGAQAGRIFGNFIIPVPVGKLQAASRLPALLRAVEAERAAKIAGEAVPRLTRATAAAARVGDVAVQGAIAGGVTSGGHEVGEKMLAGALIAPGARKLVEAAAPRVTAAFDKVMASKVAQALRARMGKAAVDATEAGEVAGDVSGQAGAGVPGEAVAADDEGAAARTAPALPSAAPATAGWSADDTAKGWRHAPDGTVEFLPAPTSGEPAAPAEAQAAPVSTGAAAGNAAPSAPPEPGPEPPSAGVPDVPIDKDGNAAGYVDPVTGRLTVNITGGVRTSDQAPANPPDTAAGSGDVAAETSAEDGGSSAGAHRPTSAPHHDAHRAQHRAAHLLTDVASHVAVHSLKPEGRPTESAPRSGPRSADMQRLAGALRGRSASGQRGKHRR